MIIQNFDIVCISTTDWFDIWGSRQHIMKRFAKYNRILFVETQVGPEHLVRDRHYWSKFKRWREGLKKIEENIFIWSPPLLPPCRYYSMGMNFLGQLLLEKTLKQIIKKLNFQNILLWVYQPNCSHLIGKFNEKKSVYHCIDEFAGGITGRKREIILTLETDLMRKANIVFIHNKGLFERKKIYNKNTYLTPSAADIEQYKKVFDDETPIPDDIKKIKKPIIAQIGNFTGKCDVELLYKLAISKPEWSFVVIGEIYKDRVNISKLEGLTNFHFLGKKKFEDLPAYQKAIDICIIPYKVTEETMYISPLKLYEYMAAGKPIISTPLPEAKEYEGLVKIGENAGQFAEHIKILLEKNNNEIIKKSLEIANANSWDARVAQMSEIVNNELTPM